MQNLKITLVLLLLPLLFAGCSGKAVPIGELPCSNVQSRVQKSSNGKSVGFEYCLDQIMPGSYVIQGNARFKALGDVRSARMQLFLVKDKEIVERIPLRVRATDMDKKFYFYKEFEYSGPFDFVAFGWNVRYRF